LIRHGLLLEEGGGRGRGRRGRGGGEGGGRRYLINITSMSGAIPPLKMVFIIIQNKFIICQ
jgi:hypothetical protein